MKSILNRSAVFLAAAFIAFAGCSGPAPKKEPAFASKASQAGRAGFESIEEGDYNKALSSFKEALTLNRSVDNRLGEVKDLINIGRVYILLNDPGSAREYLSQAVRLGGALGDKKYLSEAYASLAKAEGLAGELESALVDIERSIEMEAPGLTTGAKLNIKADILLEGKRAGEAAEVLKKAVALNKGDDAELATSLRLMAETNGLDGKTEEAFRLFEEAYRLDSAIGRPIHITEDLFGMAALRLSDGKYDEAGFLFERAYAVSSSAGLVDEALATIDKIIYTYNKSGNPGKAEPFVKTREGLLSGNGKDLNRK